MSNLSGWITFIFSLNYEKNWKEKTSPLTTDVWDLPFKDALQGCPSMMPLKDAPQRCPSKMPLKVAPQGCPSRMPLKYDDDIVEVNVQLEWLDHFQFSSELWKNWKEKTSPLTTDVWDLPFKDAHQRCPSKMPLPWPGQPWNGGFTNRWNIVSCTLTVGPLQNFVFRTTVPGCYNGEIQSFYAKSGPFPDHF